MAATFDFLARLETLVSRYRAEVAAPHEHLAVLRWQIAERHALYDRATMPGHVTTSAFVISPDHEQALLIDHIALGRWLQPGGHYEPAECFHQSAAREAVEETGVAGLTLHEWHRGEDLPFNIDSHEVPGKAARGEATHLHHDLQYLFTADPHLPLKAQREEVHAAIWKPVSALRDIAPNAAARLERVT
ncbi:NUDIX hydrolase [Chelativorans salis]|uniref:NUDIX domain-containing protein n=1 Tax=Chelativorans salis TaxID=2978478 RepID=A0ABT2LG85_9HYPH|nr:NUDIX domain-containing protein [Chelativorans sp. EGI FJ00035]MCT7373477.1 NUDIX domain-containing protein [Chelativorans sp. EGI FJ00035]